MAPAVYPSLVPLLLASAGFVAAQNATGTVPAYDKLQYVDTLIGSNNGGNVFAGATRPYGRSAAASIHVEVR